IDNILVRNGRQRNVFVLSGTNTAGLQGKKHVMAVQHGNGKMAAIAVYNRAFKIEIAGVALVIQLVRPGVRTIFLGVEMFSCVLG
ncbi:hypothetical protein ABTG83_19945, partial [Acinetobacter baumannii]